MDLKDLNNFLKVAEYENITKAAKELHMAQPHLTRQIKNLEQELGVELFVREKKRLHISDEGRFLKQQAQQLLGIVDKTKEQILEMKLGMSGTLYIGSIETTGTIYLPQWIAGFKKKYPKINYNLWSGNSKDVIERLDEGLLDLAFVREPFDQDKYDSFPVIDEEWVVLMNKHHPLAQSNNYIYLEELEKEELLVPTQRINEISNWFYKKNLQCHIICGFSPLMNAIVLVENNLGIAILPESCKKAISSKKIMIKNFTEKRYSTVSLIWKKQYEIPHVIKSFIDYVETNPMNYR